MNIFVLSKDIDRCARYAVDRHVTKMILESVQMLNTALHVASKGKCKRTFYKPNHINHPCSIWVRESLANWQWLFCLAQSLNEEAKFRYRHDRDHLSYKKLLKSGLWDVAPKYLEDIGLTPFAQAMPDECKRSNAVAAYRQYYRLYKTHLFKWTRRKPPTWI